MKTKIKNEKILCLFLTIIIISFINITSFKFFKSFNLFSDNIVLITNEGIIKYEPSSQNQTIVLPFSENISNIIDSKEDERFIDFAQFPLDEGGYVFCRINNYIHIFDQNLEMYYNNFIIGEIQDLYCILKPYKNLNGDITLIISYVNSNEKIKIVKYKINIEQTDNLTTYINEIIKGPISPEGTDTSIINKVLTCESISDPNYSNTLLVYITVGSSGYICSLKINPENLSFIEYSQNVKFIGSNNLLKSDLSHDKKNILTCLIESSSGYLNCILYDIDNNKFNNVSKIINDCYTGNADVKCITEKKECYIFFLEPNNIVFFKFDGNFNIKDTDANNTKCYTSSSLTFSNCITSFSSKISYFKNFEKFYILTTCKTRSDVYLNRLEISDICNKNTELIGLDCDSCSDNNNDSSNLLTESYLSTISNNLILIITTTILATVQTEIPTTIPITISITIPTTIPITIPIIILTTIPTTIPKFSITIPTTIPMPTTILKKIPTIIPTTILTKIPSTIPTTILTTIPTTILTTIITNPINIPSKIITTIPTTIPITVINSNPNIISTIISGLTTIPTIPTSIPSIIDTSKFSDILSIVTSKISSTNISKSTLLLLTSTSPLIKVTEKLSDNNTFLEGDNNIIQFYYNKDLIKGNINITKEELENNLEDIMKIIKIGQIYEING